VLIGMFVAVVAQLSEGAGAAIVWATGMTQDGNFLVHDLSAVVLGTAAMAIVGIGLLSVAVGALARRFRSK
jgi:hypothetical protein